MSVFLSLQTMLTMLLLEPITLYIIVLKLYYLIFLTIFVQPASLRPRRILLSGADECDHWAGLLRGSAGRAPGRLGGHGDKFITGTVQ